MFQVSLLCDYTSDCRYTKIFSKPCNKTIGEREITLELVEPSPKDICNQTKIIQRPCGPARRRNNERPGKQNEKKRRNRPKKQKRKDKKQAKKREKKGTLSSILLIPHINSLHLIKAL